MPLQIIRADLTNQAVDAIVNPTNPNLDGSGGIDYQIHQKAGNKLKTVCAKYQGLQVGEAVMTLAFSLPCNYIIHTVGPIYLDGLHNEAKQLESCYYNVLQLAFKHQLKSIAIPLISAGSYGYPVRECLNIATCCIQSFLNQVEMDIYLVVYDKQAYEVSNQYYENVLSFIDDHYVTEHYVENTRVFSTRKKRASKLSNRFYLDEIELNDLEKYVDESFSEMLFRKIDEKQMSDVECYKKANVDRKLFSKIKSNKHYQPSKQTAIAFAIALELNLKECKELLEKAGYALSRSYKFDVIIEYFIVNKIYDLYQINEVLFMFDQKLLGV